MHKTKVILKKRLLLCLWHLQKYDDIGFEVDMDLTVRIQGTSPDWLKDTAVVERLKINIREVKNMIINF
ncbi:hypothetical protein [Leuconostoc suionicum]|uniref:hypothetical protein n=1 Tax=Leuconostoc suionicum TaxID=1511761 RepID=UPI001FD13818|nr:hypothetical protein [Leuconostoc suionicum]